MVVRLITTDDAGDYTAVTRNPQGVVYISIKEGFVLMINEKREIGYFVMDNFDGPGCIAVDSEENIFLTHTLTEEISVNNKFCTFNERRYQDSPLEIAKFRRPSGIALTTKEKIYVSSWGEIRMIDTVEGYVTTIAADEDNRDIIPIGGPEFSFPSTNGLIFDNEGNLIAVGDDHWIRQLKQDGTVNFIEPYYNPNLPSNFLEINELCFQYVAIDKDGNFFLIEDQTSLYKMDRSKLEGAKMLLTKLDVLLDDAIGLAFDHKGHLIIADNSFGVLELSPNCDPVLQESISALHTIRILFNFRSSDFILLGFILPRDVIIAILGQLYPLLNLNQLQTLVVLIDEGEIVDIDKSTFLRRIGLHCCAESLISPPFKGTYLE